MEPSLTPEERSTLLVLARASIGQRLFEDGRLERSLAAARRTPALERARGVFVTLKQPRFGPDQEALRGCIGTLEADRPLYRAIVDIAAKAAFEDPRFPPLSRDELESVVIGASVLSPVEKLSDWRQIVPGLDGVQLVRGASRSVFLPHVAAEQGWDRQRLLSQLALKAGLEPDAWRSGELSTFRAESFAETDHRTPGG